MNSVLKILSVSTLAALILGLLHIWISPPLHRASVVIGAPVTSDPLQLAQNVPVGQGASILDRLANISPMMPTLAQTPETLRYRTLLNSVTVAAAVMKRSHPERTIFAEEWDPQTQQWHPPGDIGSILTRAIQYLSGYHTTWSPPDAQRLAAYIESHISFSVTESQRGVRIEYWAEDPEFAQHLLGDLVHETQAVMERDAEQRYSTTVANLRNVLAVTTDTQISEALANQIAHQELLLSLSVTGQFGNQIIDPPSVQSEADNMNPLLTLTLFLLSGVYFGLLALLLRPGVLECVYLWRARS